VKYIKPYYSKEEDGIYAKANQQLSELLKSLKGILGGHLPDDFEQVEVYPERDIYWKMLNKGEILSDEMISLVRRHFEYGLSDYACYIDSDDREVPAGRDRKGYTKYKDKYCYCHMNQAFKNLADDILDACYYADDDIQERAFEIITTLVKEYNKELESFIDNKVHIAENVINKMSAGAGGRTLLQRYDDVLRHIRISKDKLSVNGEMIDETEAFITQSRRSEQFFFDGKDIYKFYIQGGIKHKEKMFPREQYKYYNVVGYQGKIIFEAKYGELDGIMLYDANDSKINVIEKDEVMGLCVVGKKLCYHTMPGWIRQNTKYIYSRDLDGSNKRTVASVYGAGNSFKLINDFEERQGKLRYRTHDFGTNKDEEFDVDVENGAIWGF
jgi:hypothetical protein